MSNRAKGFALRQVDPHTRPRKNKRLQKPVKSEPDGGTGGDTEGLGAIFWAAVILFISAIIALIL